MIDGTWPIEQRALCPLMGIVHCFTRRISTDSIADNFFFSISYVAGCLSDKTPNFTLRV